MKANKDKKTKSGAAAIFIRAPQQIFPRCKFAAQVLALQ
jgi:hypothetical protein